MRWSCWSFSWVNSVHCSRCVCVSTAPGVCVCVCVCVCVSTAPGVCVCVCTWMGQIQRTHFTAGYTLYNCVCDKKIIYIYIGYRFFFFQNRYSIMVKCLNIGKNIGKPIYRSISNFDAPKFSIKQFSLIYFTVSIVRQQNEYEKVIETQPIKTTLLG